MKKLLIALGLAALTLPAQAETTSSVASGEAATREGALSNALRHVIEQAVGMSVDTATQVKNLKQLDDRIYTRSTGYIRSYEVVQEGPSAGGYRVTVNAFVSQEKLKEDLSPITGAIVALDGKTTMANFLLDEDRRKRANDEIESLMAEAMTTALEATLKYEIQSASTGVEDYESKCILSVSALRLSTSKDWRARFDALKAWAPEGVIRNLSGEPSFARGWLTLDLVDDGGIVIESANVQEQSGTFVWAVIEDLMRGRPYVDALGGGKGSFTVKRESLAAAKKLAVRLALPSIRK